MLIQANPVTLEGNEWKMISSAVWLAFFRKSLSDLHETDNMIVDAKIPLSFCLGPGSY